jgi:NB-ARC domain/Domain of unknown function (DUF4062)
MAPRVFLSSTSRDLKEYRDAGIGVCNRFGLTPVGMEFFGAMPAGASEASKERLAGSNVYVGLFAHRYGYVEDGYDCSVTEIEFDYAGELGIDRLCFLVDPEYPWPVADVEQRRHAEVQAFREKVERESVRELFTTVDDFEKKLLASLVDWSAAGDAQAGARIDALPVTTPPPPALLIGREVELEVLRQRLTGTAVATVIRGWPGVGKTTFVTALAHDPEIRETFTDIVLWASVGEEPDALAELAKWARALGADVRADKGLEYAMAQLRGLLQDRRALLIADDIWDADAAQPFRVGGPHCRMIFTTRFGNVAGAVATSPDDIVVLDRLSDEDGVKLLSELTPQVVDSHPDACSKLAADLEGLPLALKVAGRLLERDAAAGFDVNEMFESLGNSAAILRETAPDDRFDPRTGTTPTIDLLLRKSTDRLDPQTRRHFAFLGGMAPKPATFSVEAMKAVWSVDDPKPIVRELIDRGLLEPIPSRGRFWLHAILVMHALSLLDEM